MVLESAIFFLLEVSLASPDVGELDWGPAVPALERRLGSMVRLAATRSGTVQNLKGERQSRSVRVPLSRLPVERREEILRPVREAVSCSAEAARILLKVLFEQYRREAAQRNDSENDALPLRGALLPSYDTEILPYFCIVRDAASTKLNPLLLALLRDRRIAEEFRVGTVVVLCRPGNASVVPDLVDLARDDGESLLIRRAVLHRLPRVGLIDPPEVYDLLWDVIGRVDLAAAGCLAHSGRPVAPSLLIDGLRYEDEVVFFLRAVEAVTQKKVAFDRDRLRDVLDWRAREEAVEQAERILREWMKDHPEALNSELERDRRSYFESERGRRECSIGSIDDPKGASGVDAGFTARALAFHVKDGARRRFYLERVNRLARFVKRSTRGPTSPAFRDLDEKSKLRVLKRLLLMGRLRPSGSRDVESFFWHALDTGVGNCLGFVSLFVALGERLEMELRPVILPEHVFLRVTDDGHSRNFETTMRGRSISDDEYVKEVVGTPVPGWCLEDRSKRELLAAIVANRSGMFLRRGRFAQAYDDADLAVRLDDKSFQGYFFRAQAGRAGGSDVASQQIQSDFDRALALYPDFEKCRNARDEYANEAEKRE